MALRLKRCLYGLAFGLKLALAIPWHEPALTTAGDMAFMGISPRPTEMPGAIPYARLFGRQVNVPDNWCGFVNGDPGDTCDLTCENDYRVLKCSDTAAPFCGTFSWSNGLQGFDCDSTRGTVTSVELLADYYSTVGSGFSATLASTEGPLTITASSQSLSGASSMTAAATFPASSATNSVNSVSRSGVAIASSLTAGGASSTTASSSPAATFSSSSGTNLNHIFGLDNHHSLSVGAIVGIAVGIVAVLVTIAAILIYCCCIRPKNKRQKAAILAVQAQHQQKMQQSASVPDQTTQQPPTYYSGNVSPAILSPPPQPFYQPGLAPQTAAPAGIHANPQYVQPQVGVATSDPQLNPKHDSTASEIGGKAVQTTVSPIPSPISPVVSPVNTKQDGLHEMSANNAGPIPEIHEMPAGKD
ncbi:hypothetical protein L228DRAFT_240233 [Xylona heveae TC161]|uniref:Mid2 domain-containing protein n=1 Tax=Xylona heveae (strain CBS 132557 / TC161) TaxID=1328760 RepID=A0A165FTY3_XYLHT|nr:hypothetical protein L228DRAFT_240233 [Xylona heveae TC161]KZF21374.1 hypothetical protein L228DRAFT_240233 [Xylona heveae TC161]